MSNILLLEKQDNSLSNFSFILSLKASVLMFLRRQCSTELSNTKIFKIYCVNGMSMWCYPDCSKWGINKQEYDTNNTCCSTRE